MQNLMLNVGRLAGAVGVVLSGVAVGIRLTGQYRAAGFEAGTLLSVGTAAMVLGCFCLAAVIAERTK